MKANETKLKKRSGFTIIEMMTVMGIIAILIGLLAPALSVVRDYSKRIQQKAQFHSIDVGIELYKTDYGSYPPSSDNADPCNLHSLDPTPYCGANKLAEAMVGLDMLGFHPNSDFRSDGLNMRDDGSGFGTTEAYPVYHPVIDLPPNLEGLFGETAAENVQARGKYMELENANAFEMQDIYRDVTTIGFREVEQSPSTIIASLVLCDVYTAKRHTKKTGMPILYYRARTMNVQQKSTDALEIADDVYYYPDNFNLLALGLPDDQTMYHPLADGVAGGGGTGPPDVTDADDWQDFEDMILNTQVTQVNRPYRAESYILVCAGKDGTYGTPDDMFNFERK